MLYSPYKKFVESRLEIINKEAREVRFDLNPIQNSFITKGNGRDIILKARQQGFSSLILATFVADFLLKEYSESVVVADNSDNAKGLLKRVKYFIAKYEQNRGTQVPLKYNSKYELVNAANGASYKIGTAQNVDFGRSQTLHNLHLSEAAFYPDFRALLASAGTAVVPGGKFIIETTANGFNQFKTFWDESVLGETGFQPLFFKASDFYSPEFLAQERKRLGRLFPQEYPESPEEAFITSGDSYFDNDAARWFLENTVREPIGNLVMV